MEIKDQLNLFTLMKEKKKTWIAWQSMKTEVNSVLKIS